MSIPKLDDRLSAVASQIRSDVHADIGSDHGYLLKALLVSGRIKRGIAIENKVQPFQNSRSTLADLNADVRLADGLQGLRPQEIDSLSLCGMGGELIVKILDAYPDRIPGEVVIQPNRRPDAVRRWALANRFHLTDEQFVVVRHRYVIMRFRRSGSAIDPAYDSLDRKAAVHFGPLLIRRWHPDFVNSLTEEHRYLAGLTRRTDDSQERLDILTRLLSRSDRAQSPTAR